MTEKGRKIFNIALALIVSIAAWVFVVYNYDPMTKEKYSDIPITYTGLENLANRGYAVAEANHERVDVVLEQKRVDTGSITKDDISVTADVSNLASGENTVVLHVSGPDGTSVSDVSLKTITINIESSDREEMAISVEYPPSADDDAEPIIEEMNYDFATVIATEDRLANVDRIAAVVDPDDLNDILRPMTVELAALDKDGNKVLNVVVYPETVSFKAAAGYTKEVRLNVPVKNESDDSFERTFTVPETIVIKGTKEVINKTGSITAAEIDISQYYENAEVPLLLELPEGVYLAEGQEELIMKIMVIEKTEEEQEEEDQTG
ncbi:MAG: hypothetical protein E7230_02365 [Clostridiales bacterium]|nr:hypothetical protein [Clostridiales bacterium]